MIPAKIDFREMFLAAKRDEVIGAKDQVHLWDAFSSDFFHQNRHVMLGYALVFPPEASVIQRYKDMFAYFRSQTHTLDKDFDELASATILAVCNYWQSPGAFEQELKSILLEWPWEDWGDTCIGSAGYFGVLVKETQSKERFRFLRDLVVERYDSVDDIEREVLVSAVLNGLPEDALDTLRKKGTIGGSFSRPVISKMDLKNLEII